MAASQTPTVSVAAIESVEMDMEEEDAMMEAIQGQGTRILNLHGLTWNFQVVQQQITAIPRHFYLKKSLSVIR